MCVAIIGDEMAPAVLLVMDNGGIRHEAFNPRYTHECMYLY